MPNKGFIGQSRFIYSGLPWRVKIHPNRASSVSQDHPFRASSFSQDSSIQGFLRLFKIHHSRLLRVSQDSSIEGFLGQSRFIHSGNSLLVKVHLSGEFLDGQDSSFQEFSVGQDSSNQYFPVTQTLYSTFIVYTGKNWHHITCNCSLSLACMAEKTSSGAFFISAFSFATFKSIFVKFCSSRIFSPFSQDVPQSGNEKAARKVITTEGTC